MEIDAEAELIELGADFGVLSFEGLGLERVNVFEARQDVLLFERHMMPELAIEAGPELCYVVARIGGDRLQQVVEQAVQSRVVAA